MSTITTKDGTQIYFQNGPVFESRLQKTEESVK